MANKIKVRFEKAIKQVELLPNSPDNDTLLKLYAFYKQATIGDVTGERPGVLNIVGRAKYDAWSKLKGADKESCMQSYVELVQELLDR